MEYGEKYFEDIEEPVEDSWENIDQSLEKQGDDLLVKALDRKQEKLAEVEKDLARNWSMYESTIQRIEEDVERYKYELQESFGPGNGDERLLRNRIAELKENRDRIKMKVLGRVESLRREKRELVEEIQELQDTMEWEGPSRF